MENYLIKNFENMNNQAINNFKKLYIKKKKKYIACNYDWKEFYSDDEENPYNNLSKNDRSFKKNKEKSTKKLSNCSTLSHKTQLKKSYTMNKIQNRIKLDIKNVSNNEKRSCKISNKKVRFPAKNLVKYIDVESYKKYNSLNTDVEFSINDEHDYLKEEKAEVKCTCFLF